MEDRIKRITELLNISEKEAEKKCIEGDKTRADYYNYYTGKTWGDAQSYDLCINSSVVGIEGAVAIIKEFILKKTNHDSHRTSL